MSRTLRSSRAAGAAGASHPGEPLERRVLLSVSFAAGAYVTPINRADVPLGTISGFVPIEPMVRVNPRDPGNVVASSHRGVRISSNAGTSFAGAVGFVDPAGTTHRAGDTDLAFDAGGRLYWVNLAGAGALGVAVSRIAPLTGAAISSVNLSSSNDDKCFIVADANPASPFANNVYVVWTRFPSVGSPEVFFSRSTNLAASFSPPVQLSSAATQGFVWPSDVGVAANGDVYVAWHANGTFNSTNGVSGRILVRRSTDGGASFGAATEPFPAGTADISANVQHQLGTIPGTQFWMQGAAQPWVLPDPARPGNVYVVGNDDPNNVFGSGDDGNIVLARSTNNGATWTRSTIVAGPANSLQVFPTASIDEFGNIVVAWYDNRRGFINAAGRWLLDVMATYSTDGGLTWAPEFRVNDQPFDPDPGAPVRFNGPPPTTRIGEYFGIDLFGGTAHVVWNGNTFSGSTPVGQQVWYDRFAIAGDVTISGDEGGAAADDVITVRRSAADIAIIEILLNGQRRYAALQEHMTSLTIDALGGNDTIHIESGLVGETGGVPLIVNGGAGNDVVHIGTLGSGLDSLGGPFTINGGAGMDQIVILDPLPQHDTYTITSTTFDRNVFSLLNYGTVENITLLAQTGNNIINVNSLAAGTTLVLDANAGTDTIHIKESAAPVTVLPSTGNDAVNINVDGVGEATAVFPATLRLGALAIGSGGSASVAAGGANVLVVTSANISAGGRLDLNDNDMIVDYTGASPIAGVQAALASAYAGGAWTGNGIATSLGAVAGTALGYAEATDLFSAFPAVFSGQAVDNTAILIRYTRYGDANLDGVVNLADFNRLAANFGQSPRRWSQGDFTYDGIVNLADFNRLAANFGSTQPSPERRGGAVDDDELPGLIG